MCFAGRVQPSGYRGSELVERCSECKAAASTRCDRCGRPACDEHRPEEGQRCPSCEAYFSAKAEHLVKAPPRGFDSETVISTSIAGFAIFGALIAVLTSVAVDGLSWWLAFAATIGTFGGAMIGVAAGGAASIALTTGTWLFRAGRAIGNLLRPRLARRQFLAESKVQPQLRSPSERDD